VAERLSELSAYLTNFTGQQAVFFVGTAAHLC